MIKLKNLIYESLDDPYKYKNTFKTEEIEAEWDDGEGTYMKDVLSPVQIVKFKTDSGVEFIWYARQNRHDDNRWEIAFGVSKGVDHKGAEQLDIEKTGKGDAFRIFATIIDITNSFIQFDQSYEVRNIIFTAKGENRAKLYIKRLVPKIEGFKVDNVRDNYGETEVVLSRTDFG